MKLSEAPALPAADTENTPSPELSRRSFLVGSVSTGLMMAFAPTLLSGCAKTNLEEKRFSPTVWFDIDSQGAVLINIAKAEMGQHVGTALARIVADELGADWTSVSIKHVDTDPKWGYMVTGGSWSVFTSFTALSQAGAAGRLVLQEAGAAMLGVTPSDCVVENGLVTAGAQSVSFADIVQRGAIDKVITAEQLAALPVKKAADRKLIGGDTRALDIPAKTNGTAIYGIDIELEGMVYARPLVPPTRYGSVVTAVDDSEAKKVAGYLGYQQLNDPSETLQGWVTVTASSYWAAMQAADALQVSWTAGETAAVNEADILAAGEQLVTDAKAGALLVDDGDVEQARSSAADTISSLYTTSSALHFALEPINATVEQKDGVWHIYSGNQWQSLILPVLAKALAVEESQIIIHQQYLGGGFGRRLYGDYMLPAVLTSQAIGKPVKLLMTRADDSRFDCVRSPSVQGFQASLDANNKLTGIEHAAAAGWPTLSMAPGFLKDGLNDSGKIDGFSISGADHWYTLPGHRVRAINNPLAQKTFLPGWLRAVGPGWVGWGVESFIDEVAHRSAKDPVEFRLDMLDASGKNAGNAPESVGGAKRLATVLRQTAERANWGADLPAGEGLGIATAFGQERTMPTWVACAAHVAVDRASGKVSVKKLTLTIDCGTVVHPGGAMAQAEGSALWGLSLALHEGTAFENGQVKDTNLDTYSPLRMADVPELDIQFIESDEFPVGLGEPGLIAIAPAIGNAIFDAVGVRVRDLPIKPETLKV